MPETSYYGGVHSIAKDSVGRIWFTGSDAVYMYDGISFNRYNDRIIDKASDKYWTFLQIVRASDKALYLGTNNGLMKFDYATVRFDCVLDGNISYVTTDTSGVIWMIRNDSIESMSFCNPQKSRHYPFNEGMGMSPLTLSLSCSGDNVYVSSGEKIYLLDTDSGEYTPFATISVRGCQVRDIEEYGGNVYVLTARNGIFCFPSGGCRIHISRVIPNGFPSASRTFYFV